ncbi:MAG: hypothetical protein ACI4II_05370 [Acutalibacteraceae bacterium]
MLFERITARYTGLSFNELKKLNYIEYLAYRRSAFIYVMSCSDKGEEYLENAWRMTQTEPDREALRKKKRGDISGK